MSVMNWSRTIIRSERMLLVLILLLAFFLRVNGLGFGLPYIFHDDEHQYVEAGLAFLKGKEAAIEEMQKLNNPPLFKTALGGLYVLFTNALIPDRSEQQAAIATQLWRTFYQYVGRFASASLGLLTVALLYALGKRLYDGKTGLLAAFFLAVSFLHVRESHFAVNDAPLTFLVTLTLYFGAGILHRGGWIEYLATGFVIGLATAAKYTGVYLAIVLLMAHFAGRHGHQLRAESGWLRLLFSRRLWSGLAMIPVGFLVGAPIVLNSWSEMLREMSKLSEYGQSGYHDLLLAPHGGWIFYLNTLNWGVGLLMLGAILAALVATLIFRYREDLMLLVFIVLLFLGMGAQQMVFVRFILPLLPPLILLLAAWLVRTSRSTWGRTHRPLPGIAVALVVLQPLVMSIWFGVLLSRPDTRELATGWLETNIPEGTVIYAEKHAVPRYSVMGRVSLPYVQLKELAFDHPAPLDYYQERGVQFILASDFHHERKFSDPDKEAGRRQWDATLAQQQLIQEFEPYWLSGERFSFDLRYGPWHETLLRILPGPIIRVYAVTPDSYWHSLDPFVESNQLLDRASIYGYEIIPEQLEAGRAVEAAIYWLRNNWQATDALFVAVVDEMDFELTRTLATVAPNFESDFRAGHSVIRSEASLQLPPETPPGSYYIRLGVYDPQQHSDLAAFKIEQTQIVVAEPELLAETEAKASATGVRMAPGISLISSELSVSDDIQQDTLVIGQDNWLVLLWATESNVDEDYSIQLTLLDPQQQVVASWSGQPVYGSYATSRWQSGQLIRDPWKLSLPDSIEVVSPDTPYYLVLSVLDHAGNVTGSESLGSVQLGGRTRSSDIPAMQHSVEATWADAVRLLGFNIRAVPESPDSGWLELDLFWQSMAPTETDYLVGLRLIDARGQVVLAHDGPPKAGEAPVSTWQPGEVVHDFRSLRYDNLAMDEAYQLEIVMIDPGSGEILPATKDGAMTQSLLLTSWP